MAEQNPIPIPSTLPELERVAEAATDLLVENLKILEGLSLRELLIGSCTDFAYCYLVGSRAWRLALGLHVPDDKDIDLLFKTKGDASLFMGYALFKLNEESGGKYHMGPNKVGGLKIKRLADDVGVLDAWWLPSGQSVAEHLMGFKHEHERVAICPLVESLGEMAITRLVRPAVYVAPPMSSLFGEISQSKYSS